MFVDRVGVLVEGGIVPCGLGSGKWELGEACGQNAAQLASKQRRMLNIEEIAAKEQPLLAAQVGAWREALRISSVASSVWSDVAAVEGG